MGLDMYLKGDHYHSAYVDDVPRPKLDNKYNVDFTKVELGYWRKHADLHGYIVKTFANDVDECQKIELTEEDLDKIILAIQKNTLVKNHSGFFFGNSTEFGYYEAQEKAKAISIFEKAKTFLKEGLEIQERDKLFYSPRSVFYHASW